MIFFLLPFAVNPTGVEGRIYQKHLTNDVAAGTLTTQGTKIEEIKVIGSYVSVGPFHVREVRFQQQCRKMIIASAHVSHINKSTCIA